MLSHFIAGVKNFPANVIDRLSPDSIPSYLKTQPEPVSTDLPYEYFIELERNYVLLKDGLGLVWELQPIFHETMSERDLVESINRIKNAIEKISDEDVVVQIILDSEASDIFDVPEYYNNPQTNAQNIMVERINSLKRNAKNLENNASPTMRRKFYVTVKLTRFDKLGLENRNNSSDITAEVMEQIEAVEVLVKKLNLIATNFEDNLFNKKRNCSDLRPLSKNEFIGCIREVFHSSNFKEKSSAIYNQNFEDKRTISEQIAFEDVIRLPSSVEIGEQDTWEILSWKMQSSEVFVGKMAALLQINQAMRVVLNIRPNITAKAKIELEEKEKRLKWAVSAGDVQQKMEVRDALIKIEKGEGVVGLSLHILYRNKNKSLIDMKKDDSSMTLINKIQRDLDIVFIKEKWAGAAIFDLCLPLAYHSAAHIFSGREEIVLTGNLPAYLPILGGFLGHSGKVQLMQSRSGDPCWLSTRSGELNPHIALLASSGAGKSFLTANYLVSALANDPNLNIYTLDVKTSYIMIAKTLATKENNYAVVNPPNKYPNLFLGNVIDPERLKLVVSVIKNTILLCDPTANITLEHDAIISESIKESYNHNKNLAIEHFKKKKLDKKEGEFSYRAPKLDDIVSNFSQICTKLNYSQDYARYLQNKLLAFCSDGLYGNIFNQEAYSDNDGDLKQINLYDLDGILSDPILKVISTQICICDIIRVMTHKNNFGKKSVFLIDEAGVLLDNSANNTELVSFVITAWKTFRKAGAICYGIANLVDDYKEKEACKAIWNISPHKIILRMTANDINAAREVKKGENKPLFSYEDELIISSLGKVNEKYSQGYFTSDDLPSGTFSYVPTGFDYWFSVSRKEEIQTCELVKEKKGNYWEAIKSLAHFRPFGFYEMHDGEKRVRSINQQELLEI